MQDKIFKSKILSETNNNPHFVKIICDNVEWVDNVNCPKNGNSKPLEVVLQRVVRQVSGNWSPDNARPFAMWRELFLENYEEIVGISTQKGEAH